MVAAMVLREQIAQNGFAIVPEVLNTAEISQLIHCLNEVNDPGSIRRRGGVYAIRNLLDVVPEVRQLAKSRAIRRLIEPILGPSAFSVRGLLFDKTPAANWKVPWHQDLSIAVSERIPLVGFGPWSTKAGVLHVQPPVEILEGMVAVRIHLDNCGESNGALKVIPGSHSKGRFTAQQISTLRQVAEEVSCPIGPGGVLLMRPLLLHASSPSQSPLHRRVIHLEFASSKLPGGLRWFSDSKE